MVWNKVFIGNDFPDEFAHSKATDKAEFPDHNKFEIMSDGMVYLFVFFAQGCKKCSLHFHMREC